MSKARQRNKRRAMKRDKNNGKKTSLKITMLNAFNGDSFIISFGNKKRMFNIVVDGGIPRTYVPILRDEVLLRKNQGQYIDLLMITHIDDDHIGGIKKMFEDNSLDKTIIKRVIYNSAWTLANYFNTEHDEARENIIADKTNAYTSFKQAKTLEKELESLGLLETKVTKALDRIRVGNAKITFLSPNEEILSRLNNKWEMESGNDPFCSAVANDYSKSIEELNAEGINQVDTKLVNMSSLAFLLELENRRILMLGDANPDVVSKYLILLGYSKERPCEIDYVKLAHHGSEKNISKELLSLIKCSNYIISTNGSRHAHPSKKTLATIIDCQGKVEFYFNSKIYEKIFRQCEYERYKFVCHMQKDIICE